MKFHKGITNLEIADLFRALAASLQLKDPEKNKFRIIAYERAANAVEHLSSEAKDLWDEEKLDEIPGVGQSISENLGEVFAKGKSKHFESILSGISPQVFELMKLSRIGVKTASKLVKFLALEQSRNPVEDLKRACIAGKIALLEGFGEESQADIIRSIQESQRQERRHLLPYAMNIADEVIDWLRQDKNIASCDMLGSLRRQASTVGDIDISVATNDSQDVLSRFASYPKAIRLIEKGVKTSSILLPGGVQVDLMVTSPKSYGSLLQHFTGSKHHNIALRELALKKGLSLSEYGIKKLKGKSEKLITFLNEVDFYKYLGLEWVPPELREDAGEIDAAKDGNLPKLVNIGDVKADLQIHSNFNIETSHDNGESSMEDLVIKGNLLGYEYLAFTEHNPSRSMHDEEQIIDLVKRKKEAIDNINYSLVKSVKNGVNYVFNSLEIDIMPNGLLPIPVRAFDFLDFALISIHSSFRQSKEVMTKRILDAFNHPKVKIFAHPTGRILNQREGIEIDWIKIFEFCIKNNKYLEINSDPMRLDLPDFLVKEAIDAGVKLSLGTDAHHKDGMDNMKWGVSVARRGWAKSKDIINCLSLQDFEKMLQ